MVNQNNSSNNNNGSKCCGINFLRYCLYIFNLTFFLSGIAIIIFSIWTIFWKHQYVSLLPTETYVIGTYALLSAGILATIGGFLGCCGLWREQRALLLIYILVLIIVFLLEAFVGVIAFIYERNITKQLHETLNDTFLQNYAVDETMTNAIDQMQQENKCCGAIRFEDWQQSVWVAKLRTVEPDNEQLVPDSCCITQKYRCGERDHPSNIPYTGCIYKFTDDLREHLNILACVGSGICSLQIVGLIITCLLYVKLKPNVRI